MPFILLSTVLPHSFGHMFVFNLLNILLNIISVFNKIQCSGELLRVHRQFIGYQYTKERENDAELSKRR